MVGPLQGGTQSYMHPPFNWVYGSAIFEKGARGHPGGGVPFLNRGSAYKTNLSIGFITPPATPLQPQRGWSYMVLTPGTTPLKGFMAEP